MIRIAFLTQDFIVQICQNYTLFWKKGEKFSLVMERYSFVKTIRQKLNVTLILYY